jgi:hypothetical protein
MAKELSEILEPAYNPDYWSDIVIVRAGAAINRLNEKDWTSLLDDLNSKQPYFCIHLAQALLFADDW